MFRAKRRHLSKETPLTAFTKKTPLAAKKLLNNKTRKPSQLT
jgi:hypothetical protein